MFSQQAAQTLSPAQPGEKRYRTPPGCRVIHAVVPETTFVHVHKMALESGMRFTHYLSRFLEEAFPYPPESAHADASRTRA